MTFDSGEARERNRLASDPGWNRMSDYTSLRELRRQRPFRCPVSLTWGRCQRTGGWLTFRRERLTMDRSPWEPRAVTYIGCAGGSEDGASIGDIQSFQLPL